MLLEKMMQFDARVSDALHLRREHTGWWQAGVFFAHSGDSWFWLIGLVAVWFFSGPEWRARAVILAFSLTLEAVVVLGIKFTVRRSRPAGDWGAIYRSTDPHSFPSGHAARAFLLAVMAWGLGPLWFAWVLTLWAPLVSLARVALRVHYFSDVAAGALIGVLSGWILLQAVPWMNTFFWFLY